MKVTILDSIQRITDYLWEIPKGTNGSMRVPARIYATRKMLEDISRDRTLPQLQNVATLPGILCHALAMPDAHEGYGFPIGGVAAFDMKTGVISPGGIGYDINCGVRLLATGLTRQDFEKREKEIVHSLNRAVPSGVGRGGPLRLTKSEVDDVLSKGSEWAVAKGYGTKEDLEYCESGGRIPEANPDVVSARARSRGRDQLGTLGAGNHFVEVSVIDMVYDTKLASEWGISEGQIVVMIHSGSRGLGHQVATDYVSSMLQASSKYGIELKDRELACVPFLSEDGQNYFGAMSAAANFAWANRQLITWEIREDWEKMIGPKSGELRLIYDVAHNVAKVEEHEVDGSQKHVLVHRKGATRAFPGQPVIIPGTMGTSSYLLVGTDEAMKQTFGSVCHGAGRRMSRGQASREVQGKQLQEDLERKGVFVEGGSYGSIAEEAPSAYKDIEDVVGVVDAVGIARKVVRFRPVLVVKG